MPTIITTVGEVIVDFVSTRAGALKNAPAFVKAVGGEGANVAVGLAKLGSDSRFVGKVGADAFGRFLVEEMRKNGVDVGGIIFDRQHKTRLAFVSLSKKGERDFEFWEKSPAGEQLQLTDVDIKAVQESRIVNVAPLLLPKQPARSSAFEIAETVRSRGSIIAFDANIRLQLWKSAAEARRVTLHMIRRASILRLNIDEARFLTGIEKTGNVAAKLRSIGPELVVITLGEKGSYFQTAATDGFVRGFKVKVVDTTGCGDAFFSALLHEIAGSIHLVGDLSAEELTSICRFANAVGALTALKRGGATAIPSQETVVRLLKRNRNF